MKFGFIILVLGLGVKALANPPVENAGTSTTSSQAAPVVVIEGTYIRLPKSLAYDPNDPSVGLLDTPEKLRGGKYLVIEATKRLIKEQERVEESMRPNIDDGLSVKHAELEARIRELNAIEAQINVAESQLGFWSRCRTLTYSFATVFRK